MSTFYVVLETTGAREGTYKTYKTWLGANKFAAKLTAKHGVKFAPASAEYYVDVLSQRTTTVKNLLSGKEVTIPLVDLGGCCDPSTERYFSM